MKILRIAKMVYAGFFVFIKQNESSFVIYLVDY